MLTFECFARFFGTAQNNASDYKQILQIQNKFNINLKPKIIAKHLLWLRASKN